MPAPRLIVLGCRLHALETVPVVGEALGLSRGQSFRAATGWPCVGEPGARRVVVPRLMSDLGIDCIPDDEASHNCADGHSSAGC